MLTGSIPPDDTGLPDAALSESSIATASTEIWLLPASAARTNFPSYVACSDPCEPTIAPVPAPPVENGEPANGVRVPSAC
jgi:hypothetical protein